MKTDVLRAHPTRKCRCTGILARNSGILNALAGILEICALGGLGAGLPSLAAQDVQADSLRLRASPYPVPAVLGSPQITGTPGTAAACYWLETEFASDVATGASDLSGPQCSTKVPGTLSGANAVALHWNPADGAVSYTVLKTATSTKPTSGSVLLINTTRTSTTDIGQSLTSWTAPTCFPSREFRIDFNRDLLEMPSPSVSPTCVGVKVTGGMTVTGTTTTKNLTVTDVLTMPGSFTVGGNYVINAGTCTGTLNLCSQDAGLVFAGPDGLPASSTGAPTFKVLTTNFLPSTAITPGTYGNATNVPVLTFDRTGRATGASSTAITFPAAPVTSVFGRTGAVAAAANDYSEAQIAFTDVTTGNVSTSKHGYAPKLPNDATKFLNGVGGYAVPPAGASPAGANGDVQTNNGSGGFAGSSGVSASATAYGGTNFVGGLYVGGSQTNVWGNFLNVWNNGGNSVQGRAMLGFGWHSTLEGQWGYDPSGTCFALADTNANNQSYNDTFGIAKGSGAVSIGSYDRNCPTFPGALNIFKSDGSHTLNFQINDDGKIYKYGGAAPTNGLLMIGDTAAGNFQAATLTAGNGVTITNAAHAVTVSVSGNLIPLQTLGHYSAWIKVPSNGVTTSIGDSFNNGFGSFTENTGASSTEPPVEIFTTGSSSGNTAGFGSSDTTGSSLVFTLNRNPVFSWGAFSITSTANIGAWAIATDTSLATTAASATPAGNSLGFRYDTGVPDTNWQCGRSSAGVWTFTDSGIAPDTSAHNFRIAYVDATSTAIYYIDDVQVCSVTTALPADTVVMRWGQTVRTLTAAAKAGHIGTMMAVEQ